MKYQEKILYTESEDGFDLVPFSVYRGYRLCGDCARFVLDKAQSEYGNWDIVVISQEVPRLKMKTVVHCYFENSSGDLADCRGEFSRAEADDFFKPFAIKTTEKQISLWGQKTTKFSDIKAFVEFVNEYWQDAFN